MPLQLCAGGFRKREAGIEEIRGVLTHNRYADIPHGEQSGDPPQYGAGIPPAARQNQMPHQDSAPQQGTIL